MKVFYFSILFCVIAHAGFSQNTTDPFYKHNKAAMYVNKAQELIENGDMVGATQFLTVAVRTDSTVREAYLKFYTIGDVERYRHLAIDVLNKGKNIFVEDDELRYYLGCLHQMNKDYDVAIQEFSDAITLSKMNGEDFYLEPSYYSSRGACYLYKEKYEEALVDFDKALILHKQKGPSYANRGIALYKLKRTNEACVSWQKAEKAGISSVSTYLEKYCKECQALKEE